MRAPVGTMKRARDLRREISLPEVLLWRDLRRMQVEGLRFRRQHAVGPYVLDFFCAAHQLGVEVDGASHDGTERAVRDTRRDLWLAGQGIRVLRIPAIDILSDARRVDALATIAAAVAPSAALCAGFPSPAPRRRITPWILEKIPFNARRPPLRSRKPGRISP